MKYRYLSLALALTLLLTACAPAGTPDAPAYVNPGDAVKGEMLHLAAYPEYPEQPPEDVGDDWEAYQKLHDAYSEKARALRGEPADEAFGETLAAFYERTVSPVLTGAGTENRIFSPVNLYFALSMLSSTAAGESQGQLQELLGISDSDRLAEQVGRAWNRLYMDNGMTLRRPAASVWLNKDVSFKDDALKALSSDYRASSAAVEMGTDAADALIGQWLSEMSGGMLAGFPIETSPETVMELFTTLYYEDQWQVEFDTSKTAPDTFTCADGTQETIDFLEREADGNFILDENFAAARLGLKGSQITFVLPDPDVNIDDLLSDPTFWERTRVEGENIVHGEILWKIPKLDVKTTVDLGNTLKALGVTDIFDEDRADFTPLTDDPAWVGGVQQGTAMKLDERGIAVGSYTRVTYMGAALVNGRCEMVLDRPFLFYITARDVNAEYLLFVGVVNEV